MNKIHYRILILTSCIFILSILWTKVERYDHATSLIGFGCLKGGPCLIEQNKKSVPEGAFAFESGGYDGQFYYYIAHSIYLGSSSQVDDEALRWSRVGFSVFTGWAGLIFGSRGIVYAMIIVPLFFHFLAGFLLLKHVQTVGTPTGKRLPHLALFLFLFNPFSITCFLLSVADALALSLSMVSALLFLEFRRQDQIRTLLLSMLFFLFAILTKEASLILLPFFLALTRTIKQYKVTLLSILAPIFMLLLWWQHLGYSPVSAINEHGGSPLLGLAMYVAQPDALFSGRSLFVLFIVCMIAIVATSVAHIVMHKKLEEKRIGALLILVASIAFMSVATYNEYWTNYANIVRFGTMMVLGLCLHALLEEKNSLTYRWIQLSAALFIVWDLWIVKDVVQSRLLPGFMIH